MWVIRAYDSDDELVAEHELPGATPQDLTTLLGFAPTELGSTPLDAQDADLFARNRSFAIVKDADYFLDFDAEPQTVAPTDSPRTAALA